MKMNRALKHANNELLAAKQAQFQMRAATDFDTFEVAWRNFLSALEKIWTKLERTCKAKSGFQQWQEPFKNLRESDPLLKYLYHARHVDQHTIKEILEFTPGKNTIHNAHSGDFYINNLVINP
jgi:hypothetical protein